MNGERLDHPKAPFQPTPRCCGVLVQVTSAEEVGAALKLTQKEFGRLDLVVNCAGVGIAVKTYNSKKDKVHELEDFQRVINVSVCVCGGWLWGAPSQ